MSTRIANRPTITIAFFALAAVYFLVDQVIKQPVPAAVLKLAPTLVIFVSALIIRYGLRDPFTAQYKTMIPYSIVLATGASIVGDLAGEFKPGFGNSALLFQIFFFAIAQIFYSISFMKFCGKERVRTASRSEMIGKAALLIVMFTYLVIVALSVLNQVENTVVLVAIFIYMLLIAAMATLSVVQKRPHQGWFIAGAMFFCISDSIIAINTFAKPIPCASLLIMSTYFLAQYCLNIMLFPKR